MVLQRKRDGKQAHRDTWILTEGRRIGDKRHLLWLTKTYANTIINLLPKLVGRSSCSTPTGCAGKSEIVRLSINQSIDRDKLVEHLIKLGHKEKKVKQIKEEKFKQ